MVVSKIFYFHTYVGKIHILTNIFQMGVETTNQTLSANKLLQAGEEKNWKGEKKETYFLAIKTQRKVVEG